MDSQAKRRGCSCCGGGWVHMCMCVCVRVCGKKQNSLGEWAMFKVHM